MAQKRTRCVHLDQLKSFNLFTAFGEDGKMKALRPNLQDLETDEDEDENIEDIKAKLSGRNKGKAKVKTAQKRKQNKYEDSDDDDEDDKVIDVTTSPTRNSNGNGVNDDSPSPPPPPEFDDKMVAEIRRNNKQAAKTLHNLDNKLRSYKMSKALAAMDNVSPVIASPSELIDLDAPITRETITVKVRSRKGLIRYENYPMNQTFEKIFTELGMSEGVERRRVRITRKGEDILQEDTPNSVSLHVADILDYVIVDGVTPALPWFSSTLTEEDYVRVTLRTREKNCKTITKKLAKIETFEEVFQAFAEVHEKPVHQLQFSFDGDDVSPTATPQDLDMSEENVIDVVVL
ncbi:uncharacterized protein LOC129254995 [Lytechinus pictus]|uniref:uncharacterized protein LOC129254995 n=1 Tax=Lytechinus pictus TaxID=7653 RepID=UPI0030B9D170